MAFSQAPHIPAIRKANKIDLAEWFGVSLPAVDGWVRRGCPYVQKGQKGTPWVFDLRDVAEWRFSGNQPVTDDALDPERMPPKDRKDWYDGEKVRIALERERGQLVTLDEYRQEMARVLKEIAATLETLPDVLERKCSLAPDAVITMQGILDDIRTGLADRIIDHGE